MSGTAGGKGTEEAQFSFRRDKQENLWKLEQKNCKFKVCIV